MKHDKTGGFSSLRDFMVAVRKACDKERIDGRLTDLKTAGHMEIGSDVQGGYAVPEQWAAGIFEAVELEGAIVRPRARTFSTKRDSLKLRTLVDSDRSANIFGGIVFYWIEEAEQKAASYITKPAIGLTELNMHKLVGGCFVSNELEDDYNETFDSFMRASFGAAIAFIEDDYFIWGNGVNQPLGIMPSGAMISETRSAVNNIDWVDFANMTTRLLPASWARAIWLISPSAMDQLLQMNAAGANQAVMFDASRMTLLNRPIVVTEKCAAMGTSGDIILADWKHYAIADRGLAIAGSRHADYDGQGFKTDETFWRVVLRTDGQPLLSAPITPKNGPDTLGPFVCLTTTS